MQSDLLDNWGPIRSQALVACRNGRPCAARSSAAARSRWHQQHQRRKGTDAATAAADAAALNNVDPDLEDIDPVNPTPPRIALLLRAEEGAVRSAQANLAAAITRHLSRPHVLTFTYGTHQSKGDTLLAFDSLGVPLQAYFLSTSVFRDAFSAI